MSLRVSIFVGKDKLKYFTKLSDLRRTHFSIMFPLFSWHSSLFTFCVFSFIFVFVFVIPTSSHQRRFPKPWPSVACRFYASFFFILSIIRARLGLLLSLSRHSQETKQTPPSQQKWKHFGWWKDSSRSLAYWFALFHSLLFSFTFFLRQFVSPQPCHK